MNSFLLDYKIRANFDIISEWFRLFRTNHLRIPLRNHVQSPTFVCIPIAFQAANVYTRIIHRTSSILIQVRDKVEKKENYISILRFAMDEISSFFSLLSSKKLIIFSLNSSFNIYSFISCLLSNFVFIHANQSREIQLDVNKNLSLAHSCYKLLFKRRKTISETYSSKLCDI